MQLLIITGLSGSGKTSTLHALEDIGFYCIDNLPILMLSGLVSLFEKSERKEVKLAVGMDIRERGFIEKYPDVFLEIHNRGIVPEIIFLEASTDVLLRRFEETRRAHPLIGEGSLLEGIVREEVQMTALREKVLHIINTSFLNIHQLRRHLYNLFETSEKKVRSLQIELISFSYARGLPHYADFIMDVRFLPNPHYEADLRDMDGRQAEIQRYICRDAGASEILNAFYALAEAMIAFYEKDDRTYFVFAVGCTGGKHRSVAVVCHLEARLAALGYSPQVLHRDIDGKKKVE